MMMAAFAEAATITTHRIETIHEKPFFNLISPPFIFFQLRCIILVRQPKLRNKKSPHIELNVHGPGFLFSETIGSAKYQISCFFWEIRNILQ
jgi:hypothetical protein